jgi:hypothetical protein
MTGHGAVKDLARTDIEKVSIACGGGEVIFFLFHRKYVAGRGRNIPEKSVIPAVARIVRVSGDT